MFVMTHDVDYHVCVFVQGFASVLVWRGVKLQKKGQKQKFKKWGRIA